MTRDAEIGGLGFRLKRNMGRMTGMCRTNGKTMTYLYIIQMHSGSMPSCVVRRVTGYRYSHVALSLEKDCGTVYSFGRKSLYNFLNGGFTAERRDGRFFARFPNTDCRVLALEVTDGQYRRVQARLTEMQANGDAYRYDFLGAFLRLFRLPVRFRKRYVCSQFVAEVLEDAGICSFEKPACLIRPQDFDGLENAVEIYRGRYLRYGRSW